MEAYYTSHGGRYLAPSNCDTDGPPASLGPNWMDCLKTSGELSAPAASISYNTTLAQPCTTQSVGGVSHVVQNGICYTVTNTGGTPVVYARLESASEASKCDPGGIDPYFLWSTADGRGGLVCYASGTVPAPAGVNTWNSKQ